MYGEKGILETDGERVQCHICGKWYRHLGGHIWFKHSMTANEYREEHGLNRTQTLISFKTYQILSEINGVRLKSWIEKHPDEHKKHGTAKPWVNPCKRRLQTRIAMSNRALDKVKKGIHHFQQSEHREKMRLWGKKAFQKGVHPFQRSDVKAKALSARRSLANSYNKSFQLKRMSGE